MLVDWGVAVELVIYIAVVHVKYSRMYTSLSSRLPLRSLTFSASNFAIACSYSSMKCY